MKLPSQFFVAGTDTDVGKTKVSLDLISMLTQQGHTVGVLKPIAAGGYLANGKLVNEDAVALIEASRSKQPYEQVNPYLFAEPISPHIAAGYAGVEIDLDLLASVYLEIKEKYEVVLVEGAGGWMTPLSDTLSMADLAYRLKIPIVLVVGLKLGCLNHAQLTQKVIQQSGLKLAGWIANTLDPDMPYMQENIDYLVEQMDCPLLAHISYKSKD